MGYTTEELSNISNVSTRTISRIETGNNNINFASVVNILKSLNLFGIVSDVIHNSVYLNNRLRVRKKE